MSEGDGRAGIIAALAAAIRSLSLSNVLVVALIAAILVPAYVVYTLLNDKTVMDRFLSSYDEYTEVRSGCTVRTVRLHGGPWRWSIATGFAYAGSDRWNVSVILQTEPDDEAIRSYCATLGLIVEKMHGE
jgi:hypothetical protein